MASKAKVPPTRQPPERVKARSQGPRRRSTNERPWWVVPLSALAALAVLGAALAYVSLRGGGVGATESAGLPDTPDYHSLLVAPSDPDALVLGTHVGLYRSADGGRTWRKGELDGNDAMNLVQPTDETVWAAGHSLLARSGDGGATWHDVRPQGLPGLDVHGFAVDPRRPRRLYAAIAGQGLFRSEDGGRSFRLASREVGPGVMAIAVLRDGSVLAGDMQQSVLAASTDRGATWKALVQASVMGLAVDPSNPRAVLASGPGVLRSTDGGKTWGQTLELADGSGPVAFAPSDPERAYVVGFDRTLYRSDDGGASWQSVAAGKEG